MSYRSFTWESEFGRDYEPPADLLELSYKRIIRDESYGNDVAPHFVIVDHEPETWVWSQPEDKELREYPDSPRFWIDLREDTAPTGYQMLFETDSVDELIHFIQELRGHGFPVTTA